MTPRDALSALARAAGLLLVASAAAAFPWSTDMFRGAAVQPFTVPPRVMPADTRPAQAAAGAPPHGARLFATYCAVCHGASGHGDGSVAFLFAAPPPDLADPKVVARTDAQLVEVINGGERHRLAYGGALSQAEQLAVARYVRTLQNGGGR
jgi:mono/diheme cytochrome c family protein